MALVLAVLAVVSVLALVAVAGSATGSPQPVALCSVCASDAFEEAGGERSLTVAFDHDGTAEWRAEVRITNESLAEEWRDQPPVIGGPRTYRTGDVTDDDRLVVTYREWEAVRPAAAGTLLSDAFYRPSMYLIANVHEFTVIAPDGYAVARAPGDATVDGATATWTFDDPRIDEGHGPTFDGGRVVFAPADATAPTVRAFGAVAAADLGPAVHAVHPLYWATIYAGIGAMLALAHFGRRADERLSRGPLAVVSLVTVVVPLLVMVGLSSSHGVLELPGPRLSLLNAAWVAVLGVGFGTTGLLGYAVATRSPREGPW